MASPSASPPAFAQLVTPRALLPAKRADGDATDGDARKKKKKKNKTLLQNKPTRVSSTQDAAAADDGDDHDHDHAHDATAAPPLPFAQLYRFASRGDQLALAAGAVCAAANGALLPCMALVFGDAVSAFQRADGGVDARAIHAAALQFLLLAVGLFVTDYAAFVLFAATAERQMQRLRGAALRHLLYMDLGWFDAHDALQLSSRLTGDTVRIKDGMGPKLGEAIKFACQFVAGYAIGLAKGWHMALVMSCVTPLMALSLAFFLRQLQSRQEAAQQMYAEAGAVAEETLGAIRTVASLTAEPRALAAFAAKTTHAERENVALARLSSAVFGLFIASIWAMYAAGLWYGGAQVADAKATPGEVFQGFFGVLIGTLSLAHISPNVNAVARARGAAAAIYAILDTPSAVDASDESGVVPDAPCAGRIEAMDVHFAYPSRPDAPVLRGYSLAIEAGATVAFVGASGGGKSTLVALLERFYAPQRGRLLLDGRDVATLRVRWLRAQIGLVAQEPVLFARSIFDNIAAGASGDDAATVVPREQVVAAAKLAHAHDFIMALPQQYDTLVGEQGVALSGGQKQRVAIARAVVRRPAVLVLDEATSALDAENERVVQRALNGLLDATHGGRRRTTLVIAHRLSTVRRADKIVVVADGRVVEEGAHDALLALDGGVYRKLYQIQEEKAQEEAQSATQELLAATASGEAAAAKDDDEEEEEEEKRKKMVRRRTRSCKSVEDEEASTQLIDEHEEPRPFSIRDAMRFSRPELPAFAAGMAGAAVCGLALPVSGVLVSEMVNAMALRYAQYLDTSDRAFLDALARDVTRYGAFYAVGAVVVFACTALHSFCFTLMAEKLTTRLRGVHFAALCRQNVAFFDAPRHATGALTAELATDATKVAQISGDTLGRVVQAAFTLAGALAISFALGSWQLTLVMLGVFPLLVAGQVVRWRQVAGQDGLSDELAAVGAHASEALANMRTVAALGLEPQWAAQFTALLETPLRRGRREAQTNALALGYSSFIVFSIYALVFYYGGELVVHREISFLQLMRTLMAFMMSADSVSSATTFFSEAARAAKAGGAIVAVRDRVLPIDALSDAGLTPATVDGHIQFEDVAFRYPTRPRVRVLEGFSLAVAPGETIAFCGPSGGGKSTCIALLERFYDPLRGRVLLDGRDLRSLNVRWLRRQIGLVGQEPTLFVGSIADNIAYGLDARPSQREIEVAARVANAHAFIAQFPDGYATQVGAKGEQLSGGQKQRLAIARAVLRNPTILLLDEATSALDAESETVVQAALDNVVALARRTTLVVAHRLSTIRRADRICVVSGGCIAESGSHAELLAAGGMYKSLVEMAAA